MKVCSNTSSPGPGTPKGTLRDYVLESNVTMREVYKQYCKATKIQATRPKFNINPKMKAIHPNTNTTQSVSSVAPVACAEHWYRCVSYGVFTKLWHRFCSNIKFCPSKSDLCDVCDMALVSLRHSLSKGERIRINSSYLQHITQAKVLQEAYNTNIDKATLLWQALCRQGVKKDESQNQPGNPYLNTQM